MHLSGYHLYQLKLPLNLVLQLKKPLMVSHPAFISNKLSFVFGEITETKNCKYFHPSWEKEKNFHLASVSPRTPSCQGPIAPCSIVRTIVIISQGPKNPSSRVALLPGIFFAHMMKVIIQKAQVELALLPSLNNIKTR